MSLSGDKKEKIVAIVLVVVIVGTVAGLILSAVTGGGAPPKRDVHLICQACDYQYTMSPEEFQQKMEEIGEDQSAVAGDPMAQIGPVFDCPDCGEQKSVWVARRCPNCHEYYIPQTDIAIYEARLAGEERPDLSGIEDVCPHCGMEYRQALKKARGD
jgi:DNA-directed RNA polymerase subunit M/transcription elongation factor TFIIS